MKIAITVRGSYANSNQFDYKISFLLNKGFELINSNTSYNEQTSEMSAILVGEIKDDIDVELYRRFLSIEMHKSLEKEKFRYERIDKLTGVTYLYTSEFDKLRLEMRKKMVEEIKIFLNKNSEFLSLIKESKRNYYYTIDEFLKIEDEKVLNAIIDKDKFKEAKALLQRTHEITNYFKDNLIPRSGF